MTEPEDLDEDLFADLYDGDEDPSKLPQQAPEPIAAEFAPVSADLNALPTEPEGLKQEAQQDQHDISGDGDHQNFGIGDNEMGGNGWDQRHGDTYGNMGAEHDSHGTGIKEDG
ncbi:MAG: hypothetical protein M1812_000209 [Candelaria pacifica]|nr:MAG: hypothetical protein M1812_000209 [Candelaria pacifica]